MQQTVQLSTVQILLAIAAVIVGWGAGIAAIMFRIGRFEASTTTQIQVLKEARAENKDAIQKVEAGMREEVKEMRRTVESRLDTLYKEIVRPQGHA